MTTLVLEGKVQNYLNQWKHSYHFSWLTYGNDLNKIYGNDIAAVVRIILQPKPGH